mgnify:FL=1
MIDLYLRTDTAEALAAACPFLRSKDEDGADIWLLAGDGFAFDPIGAIVVVPGTYDEEGNEITPPVIDSRVHANLRCTEAVAAKVPESIRVYPATPFRVWA